MILRAIAILALMAPPVHASCAYTPPKQLALTVTACTTVDTTKIKASGYAGMVVEGTSDGHAMKVWVPATENMSCFAFRPKLAVHGKLSFACCDGDPNPPCLLGIAEIYSAIKTS